MAVRKLLESLANSGDRTMKGEKQLRRAQKAIVRAEHRLKSARNDQAEGEALIAKGLAKMARAEAACAALGNGTPAVEPR